MLCYEDARLVGIEEHDDDGYCLIAVSLCWKRRLQVAVTNGSQ